MAFDQKKLEEILGTEVSDIGLFQTAFTHRSYLNEHSTYSYTSNERLEFLGDAVLQLISSQHLYTSFAESSEGELTNFRAAIVCTPSLADESRRMGYGALLLMSKGEEASGGRDREYILANTFEAVLGALYLEKGYEFCVGFVEKNLLFKVNKIVNDRTYKDPKSKFQEMAQEKRGVTPAYEILESWGPDHEKMFKVGVYLSADLFGVGEGPSKQKAQQAAAEDALDKLGKL